MTTVSEAIVSALRGMRILLVEVGGSHGEVLLSWYRDLTALGAEVYVACPAHIWKQLAITDAAGWLEAEAIGGLWSRLKTIMRIRRFALNNTITHVVLNTASGTTLRDVSVMLPQRCTVIGTLHDTANLDLSFNQKITTRNVDAYTVLAPYVLDRIPSGFQKRVVVVTATATAPELATAPATAIAPESSASIRVAAREPLTASTEPLRVVIAGGIYWQRRDYDALLSSDGFARMGRNIRIVLAGRPDDIDIPRLHEMLALAPPGLIEVHDDYIPHDVYARIISEADVVLPLIHPSCPDYHWYVRSGISGAMSSAWSYSKPLMLERGFEKHASLAGSIFYDVEALPDMLRRYADDRSLLAQYAVTPAFATDEVRRATIIQLLTSTS